MQSACIYYYDNYDDYRNNKNLHTKYCLFTAFKHNKDRIKLYRYDTLLFDSDKPLVYVTRIVFDF